MGSDIKNIKKNDFLKIKDIFKDKTLSLNESNYLLELLNLKETENRLQIETKNSLKGFINKSIIERILKDGAYFHSKEELISFLTLGELVGNDFCYYATTPPGYSNQSNIIDELKKFSDKGIFYLKDLSEGNRDSDGNSYRDITKPIFKLEVVNKASAELISNDKMKFKVLLEIKMKFQFEQALIKAGLTKEAYNYSYVNNEGRKKNLDISIIIDFLKERNDDKSIGSIGHAKLLKYVKEFSLDDFKKWYEHIPSNIQVK